MSRKTTKMSCVLSKEAERSQITTNFLDFIQNFWKIPDLEAMSLRLLSGLLEVWPTYKISRTGENSVSSIILQAAAARKDSN